MRDRWQPLVSGTECEEVRRAVGDIARDLEATLPDKPDPSLGGGDAGLAIFFHYAGRILGDKRWCSLSSRLLDRVVEAIAAGPVSLGLFAGVAGAGWTLAHLDPGNSELDDLDDLLLDLTTKSGWPGAYDLIDGLVGFGVYALERPATSAPTALIDRVTAQLRERAESTRSGLTWKTPVAQLPAHHRDRYPGGYYNLGLAHGVPGIVAFLGAARRRRRLSAEGERLLDGVSSWLLARRLDRDGACSFGTVLDSPEGTDSHSRAAWCYGDPGVSAALWLAGRREEAIAIAGRAASLDTAATGAIDAGLCHGAGGLLHMSLRLHHQTGEPRLREAARTWLGQTLKLRRPEEGIGGYLAYDGGPTRPFEWRPEPGLLIGAAGVGLALLGAASNIPPDWDRALLLSA